MAQKRFNSLFSGSRVATVFAVLSMALFQCGCAPVAPPAPPTPTPASPSTTVLLYIEGTNLESTWGEATANIQEMLAATPSSNVNVVMTTGAANKAVATDPVTSWKTVKRHIVKDGRVQEVQDLGATNMGTPDALKDFIVWGQNTYPATQYMLVLWDHGGGSIRGFGGDSPTGTSGLTVPQMRQALDGAFAVTGKGFELIGFDACLMATSEVAFNFAPHAKYFVASQELEPGGGWNYTPFLNALTANPAADGLTVGKAIADAYATKSSKDVDYYTLSVVDLSQVGEVAAALGDLGTLASGQIAANGRLGWLPLALARNYTDEFGADYSKEQFYNMADVGNYAATLALADPTVYQASTDRVKTAVSQAVRYAVKGPAHAEATGLSVYIPYHNFKTEADDLTGYKAIAFQSNYQVMIENYLYYPLYNPPSPPLSVSGVTASATTLSATFTSPYGLAEQYVVVTQPDAARSTITLLGRDLATLSGTGLAYARQNQSWFSLDGHQVSVLFEKKTPATYSLAVPILHRRTGTTLDKNVPLNLGILYYNNGNTGVITTAWEGVLPNGMAARQAIELKAGDIITPVFQVLNGAVTPAVWDYLYGTPFILSSDKPPFARTPISPGTYNFAFTVTDLAGNQAIGDSLSLTIPAASTIARQTPAEAVAADARWLSATPQEFWSHWPQQAAGSPEHSLPPSP